MTKHTIKVLIDGKEETAVFPFKFSSRLDERLDEATITLYSTVPYYKPLTSAEISVDLFANVSASEKLILNFVVSNDQAEEYPIGSGTYKHVLSLIEETKILDGIVCPSLTFTNLSKRSYQSPELCTPDFVKDSEDAKPGFGFPESISNVYKIENLLKIGEEVTIPSIYTMATAIQNAFKNFEKDLEVNLSYSITTSETNLNIVRGSSSKIYSYDENEEVTITPRIVQPITLKYQIVIERILSFGSHSNSTTHKFWVLYCLQSYDESSPPKKWTITDCITRVLECAKPLFGEENPEFTFDGIKYIKGVATQVDYDGSQAQKYSSVLAPEFSMTQCTLREQLKIIGSFIHAEPRLKGDTIYFDELNTTKQSSLQGNKNYVRKAPSIDINTYCTSVISFAKNITSSEKDPIGKISTPPECVKCAEVNQRLTADNAVVLTTHRIRQIEKIEFAVVNDIEAYEPSYFIDFIDVTKFLVEETAYKSLASDYNEVDSLSKAFCIYYTTGEKNVKGLFYLAPTVKATEKNYAISYILSQESEKTASVITAKLSANPELLVCRMTYIPYYDAVVTHGKPKYTTDIALTVTFEDDTTQVIQLANSGSVIKKSDYPTAKKFVFEVKRNNNNVAMSGICYPMINPGETVLPWTPYFEGLRDSAVTSLKIHGANMLGGESLKDAIKSGIPNATVDETNKTISFAAREASSFKFTDVKPNTQYTVILYGKNGTAGTKTTNIIFRYADGTNTSLGFTTVNVMSYAVGQNDTTKNLVEISGIYGTGTTVLEYEKCGIFEGNIPLEQFRPYIEPTTIPIPEAIQDTQAFPNYGKMFTHLDLVNKTYTDASYPVHFKTDDANDSLDYHLEKVEDFKYFANSEDWKEGDIAAKAKLHYYVNLMDSLPELGVLIAKGNYTNVTYDGYYLIFDAYTYDVNVDEYVSNWYGTITEIEAVFRTDTDYLIILRVALELFEASVVNPFSIDFFIKLGTDIATTMFCYCCFISYGQKLEKATMPGYKNNCSLWATLSENVRKNKSQQFSLFCKECAEEEREERRKAIIQNNTMISWEEFTTLRNLPKKDIEEKVRKGELSRSDARQIIKAAGIIKVKAINPLLILCGVKISSLNDAGRDGVNPSTISAISRPVSMFLLSAVVEMLHGAWRGISTGEEVYNMILSVLMIVLASVMGFYSGVNAAKKEHDRIKGRIFFIEKFNQKYNT